MSRLLLGEAVERAQSPHHVDGGQSDHGTIRQEFADDGDGPLVSGIVELRHDNALVNDIKIAVAGW